MLIDIGGAASVQIFHIVVVVFMRGIKNNVEVARIKTGFAHTGNLDFVSPNRKARQNRPKLFNACAQIEHRRDEHIAGNSRRAFKVEHFRHTAPFANNYF